MKKVLLISVFILGMCLFFASRASASILRPFGGLVLLSPIPGGLCAGYGPFSIKPANTAPATPYSVIAPNPYMAKNVVYPGVWILGMYSPTTSPVGCNTTSTPSSPYPAFPVTIYGTSLLP